MVRTAHEDSADFKNHYNRMVQSVNDYYKWFVYKRMRERYSSAWLKIEGESKSRPPKPRTGHPKSSSELRPGRPSTPIPENPVAAAQLTCVHDAICFFVAFSLTDFVSCGVASILFSRATSPKNAAFGFFPLGMFRQNSIAFLVLFFSTASAAAAFRFPRGPFRGPPGARTHGFPAATPHVGQATEYGCLRVSCFVLIPCFRCPRGGSLGSRLAGSTSS